MGCWDGVDGMDSCDVRRVRVIGWGGRRIGFMCLYIYILENAYKNSRFLLRKSILKRIIYLFISK